MTEIDTEIKIPDTVVYTYPGPNIDIYARYGEKTIDNIRVTFLWRFHKSCMSILQTIIQ